MILSILAVSVIVAAGVAYCATRQRKIAGHVARAREAQDAAQSAGVQAATITQLAVELAGARDVSGLKQLLQAKLPPLLGTDDFWISARLERWTVLVGERSDARSPFPKRLTAKQAAWECFPLDHGEKTYGVLGVRSNAQQLSAERREILTAASALVGAAIRNVRRQQRIRRLASRDALTSCFTRRYGAEALSREMHRIRRSHGSLSVAMLDLDNFKTVNDTYGHEVGDRVLASVGKLMKKALRASDIAVRYGGEEFLLILPDTSLPGAVRAAENLRRRIGATLVDGSGGHSISVRASVGVTQVKATEEDPHAPIRRADLAMYEAKRAGRDQVIASNGAGHSSGPPSPDYPAFR